MKKALHPVHKLFQRTAICAALSLSFLGNSHALTFNRPLVQSKQGEALRAEIDISEIAPAELVDLQANIASPDIYKAVKVEIPMTRGQPLDIQIELLQREQGRPYLRITSKQAVTTNAIDLLIDLRWSTGRLLRDMSLSLDDSKATAKSIGMPAVTGSTPPAPSSSTNAQRIQVKHGDTASGLTAGKTPEGVSLEQMLLALLRSNPDAFVESNVNRMKEGALLTLPTEQEAKAVSHDDARRQIQIQAKDFDAYRAELAARAPGGTLPKVARDSTGKLEATVQNKNAKSNQDKLTLAKPGSKDAAADNIAQQREAQDVAKRAAELSRNIAELGKIAAATVTGATDAASEAASGVLPMDVPASAAQANGQWLNELRENTLAPIGAGSLIAIMVLIGLWRRQAANRNEDDIEGLPPLNVKFNLDLPEQGKEEPVERAYIHDVATHMNETHEHPHDHSEHDLPNAHPFDAEPLPRPTMEMPNISLDLTEPETAASPYQVRIDLADELWNLGQLHTSRALMEEVANEASGADKEKALKWLAERG